MDFGQQICYTYSFLIILLFMNTTFGNRDYIAVIENFKCISTSNFVKKMSCTVDKSVGASALMEIQRAIEDIRMDTYCLLTLNKNDKRVLFNYKGIKTCEMFHEPVLNPTVKIIKQMLKPYCNLPERCPVTSNYVFKLANYSINTEYLPIYAPECKFNVHINLTSGYKLLSVIEISGRVTHKRVNAKGRRTSEKS